METADVIRLYECDLITKDEARVLANVIRAICVPEGHKVVWSCPSGECLCQNQKFSGATP